MPKNAMLTVEKGYQKLQNLAAKLQKITVFKQNMSCIKNLKLQVNRKISPQKN